MDLLIATTNPGKAREFRDMLDHPGLNCISLCDLPAQKVVEETGLTFRANAILKAIAYARSTGYWTLADDSGLEVDALNKKPGVHSARWAVMHEGGEGDMANNALLLKQMAQVPDKQRAARFVCVLALADPTGRVIFTTRETFEGQLLRAAVGSNGFGYDPLFQVAGMDCTSAELSPEHKNRISHRGRALDRMKQLMDRFEWFAIEGRV